jgi:hypothetical protein
VKTTEAFKAMGPVYAAQYGFVFGAGAAEPNPYDKGTQQHVTFMEQIERLTREQQAKFDDPTPEGQAWSDYIEQLDANPYSNGSMEFSRYQLAMTQLLGDKQ